MKNVVIENGLYVVRTPDGKTKQYKTLRGAERYAIKTAVTVSVPSIVTANTYFWYPACFASVRRRNEKRRGDEIEAFADVFDKIPTIQVFGSYEETRSHVYKAMTYRVRGRNTNLTGLIGEAARWGIKLEK